MCYRYFLGVKWFALIRLGSSPTGSLPTSHHARDQCPAFLTKSAALEYVHSTTSDVVPTAHRRRLTGAARRRSHARLTRGVHRWVTPRSIAYSSLITEN